MSKMENEKEAKELKLRKIKSKDSIVPSFFLGMVEAKKIK